MASLNQTNEYAYIFINRGPFFRFRSLGVRIPVVLCVAVLMLSKCSAFFQSETSIIGQLQKLQNVGYQVQ